MTEQTTPLPDFFKLNVQERMDELLSGRVAICDESGHLGAQPLGTITVRGKCLGFDNEGDMMIQDLKDLENPHYMDARFFVGEDRHDLTKYVSKDIMFCYGIMIPGRYKITLL